MKNFRLLKGKLSRLVFLTVFLTLMCMYNALAYLDVGTTSYIFQALAAVIIAGGVSVGIFWKKIKLFFRKRKMMHLEKKLAKKADSAPAADVQEPKE